MPTISEPTNKDFLFSILLELNISKEGTPDIYAVAYALCDQALRLYAEKAQVKPALQKLYAKRELVLWFIGQQAQQVNVSQEGFSLSLGEIVKNYELLHKAIELEIAQIEKQHASTLAVMGSITAVVPSPTPNGRFPANSPLLLGDPNYSRYFRR
jgi:hypothetical protein